MGKLNIVKLGKIEYSSALEIQESILALRQRNEIEDTLLLLEHPPVLTLGKRGEYRNILLSREELLQRGVKVFEVNRGGDVTYHGPGQLVGYPVVDLKDRNKSIKDYVYKIEDVFISLLKEEYGIEARRDEREYTGVWVGNSKITAIGVAVKKWVTMHGFAFNINTSLEHFSWINPCGITDRGVTSLQKLVGHELDMESMYELVIKYFCRAFGYETLERPKPEELMKKEGAPHVSEEARMA